METPKRKVDKLSMTYRSSTPKRENNSQCDNDYSPLFMSNTQDCIDSVDVVWDWNSPQSKRTIKPDKKPPKRLHSSKPTSTSTPSPSNNTDNNQHIPSFNKLKEQLERLRNQLVLDNAEKRAKEATSTLVVNKAESPRRHMPALPKPKNLLTKSFSSESLGNSLFEDDFNISDIITKSAIPQKNEKPVQLSDSLDIDLALDEFQEEDYELLSQAIPLKIKGLNMGKKTESKLMFKDTFASRNNNNKSVCRKSKSDANMFSTSKQYSQEEIEKKRKLALAKLEERRMEDIIEKKRQQALMRLETSRKKNLNIATSGIKRYNSS